MTVSAKQKKLEGKWLSSWGLQKCSDSDGIGKLLPLGWMRQDDSQWRGATRITVTTKETGERNEHDGNGNG
jgi:hypothetical protein